MGTKATAKKKRRPAVKVSRQREAVRRHRTRMRKQGMRLLQLWVPDTDGPGFAAECRRQSLLVSRNPSADDRALDRDLEAWAAEANKGLT